MSLAHPPAILIQPSHADLYLCLASGVEPRPLITVTQWADAHRKLSSKASGEDGQYKSARTPHLREIMDCLSAHSPVQRVTVMKPTQGGVTEVALNWIGYVMAERPAPMLVVVPTLELRKRWVRQRLDPMLAESPQLAQLFDSRRTRDGGNSEELKDFPGGMVLLGGANSPASLSSMPICYVVCDEVNRFPWEVGDEGDPLGVIDERTKAFVRRKVLLISTPTIKGQSRISLEYALSDQRRLLVPCPHCATYIELRWQDDDGKLCLDQSITTGRVWYVCRSCGAGIEEHSKTAMLAEHRWQPRFPDRAHRGYHWNGLYAPIGLGFTWREMLDKWNDAQSDTTKLKVFINTSLAEDFEEKGFAVDDVLLLGRVEKYADGMTFDIVVAFVDVQKDRLEFTTYGFRRHKKADGKPDTEEAWALDHVVLPGDTADSTVWEDLEQELDAHGVQLVGIDAGYNTKMVNDFVISRPWCIATKGVAGMDRPLVEDERKRRHRLRMRRKRGVPQEPIGVDTGKSTLYARLRKTAPGPGYIHYPDAAAFDAEFFRQLTAEKLVPKVKHGRPYQEWVKQRPRNEALDCAVGAIAIFHLSSVIAPRLAPQPFAGETISAANTPGPRGTSQRQRQASEDFAI